MIVLVRMLVFLLKMARQQLNNLVFNEESDESDNEGLGQFRRARWIREREDFFEDYDEVDFKTHFRLSRRSALLVLDRIENNLEFPTDA